MRLKLRFKAMNKSRDEYDQDLVPFIGLFALLVCTLLVSALWGSISFVDIDKTKSTLFVESNQKSFRIILSADHLEVFSLDSSITKLSYDEFFEESLESIITLKNSPIEIHFQDNVFFGRLIQVFQRLQKLDFQSVSLAGY